MEIKEAYVSFEVAKLLKEKGFNEPIRCWYDNYGDFHNEGVIMRNEDCLPPTVMCPTHQMAMAWLRNEYDIDMWVEYCIPDDAYVYTILIKDITEGFTIIHSEDNYPTYEEAIEAGLKYYLENLI